MQNFERLALFFDFFTSSRYYAKVIICYATYGCVFYYDLLLRIYSVTSKENGHSIF